MIKFSHGHRGHIVHAEDSLHGEAIEQSIRYDLPASAYFFCRLKNQVDGTVEFSTGGQIFGRSKQHAGVPVMATGMHHTWIAGSIGYSGFFRNGQRIDIRAQADRLIAAPFFAPFSTTDDGHDTGSGERMYFIDREGLQAFLNKGTGAGLGKSQFWIGMEISAPAHHLFL
jgi:hypothetical protein